MNPKIIFKIDVERDIENAKWFIQSKQFLDWFLSPEMFFITRKEFSRVQQNKIITAYTRHMHDLHKAEIKKGVTEIAKEWGRLQNRYFILINKLFKNHPWPKGKYIGYASIHLMFPRDVREKTFYFPYAKNKFFNPQKTIGHEVLHFIFFDYIQKKYGIHEHDKLKGKPENYIWQVSETFNTVIENWAPYKKIFKTKLIAKPYPECQNMYKIMKRQWDKNPDMDVLLDQWF